MIKRDKPLQRCRHQSINKLDFNSPNSKHISVTFGGALQDEPPLCLRRETGKISGDAAGHRPPLFRRFYAMSSRNDRRFDVTGNKKRADFRDAAKLPRVDAGMTESRRISGASRAADAENGGRVRNIRGH